MMVLVLTALLILSDSVTAEVITVYNSTNFTKPINLTAPVNITAYNTTQDLPIRKETISNSTVAINPHLLYQLPSGFYISENNSIFENISNISVNQTNSSNSTSFMNKLNENKPLKYGFILFLVVIVIIVAYVLYLNFGGEVNSTISFDRDFAPTGHM